jgi:nucleotide-binding universal stress UspA family protein
VSRIIGRVVLGVSGSPENLHALRHAVELARHYDATLIAVNAQATGSRIAPPRRNAPVWQHAASLVIRAAFDDGLGGLPPDIECVLLAAPGDPRPALVHIADRPNDVLVLGTPRRRRPRLTPRTIAAYCMDHAVCSVLSVPPPPLARSARTLSVKTLR